MFEGNQSVTWTEKVQDKVQDIEYIEWVECLNECMSVNGNKFFIEYIFGDIDFNAIYDECKDRFNEWVDSGLFLQGRSDGSFNFFVMENDGSFSEMCGNWAIGGFLYLKKHWYLFEDKVTFVTKSFNKIEVGFENEEKDQIYVDMWEVASDEEAFDYLKLREIINCDSMDDLKEIFSVENIKEKIDSWGSNAFGLNEKFPDNTNLSNYDTYLLSLIDNLKDDKNYFSFLNEIIFKDVISAGGEPHIIVEIPQIDNKVVLDYYLKLTSFILREGSKWEYRNFPKGINFMFYFQNGEKINMYPSERGVYNGINFDQTEACGTGSLSLGTHLLRKNEDFLNKDKVEITNRSGNFSVTKNGEQIKLVTFLENVSYDFGPKSNNETFSSQQMIERVLYNLNKNKVDEEQEEITKDNLLKYIEKTIEQTGSESAKEINKQLGKWLLNSGWHETEFPVDPYKLLTVINSLGIMNSFNLRETYINYIDTVKLWSNTQYPNINMKKKWSIFSRISRFYYSKENLTIKDMLKRSDFFFKTILGYIPEGKSKKWKSSEQKNKVNFIRAKKNIFLDQILEILKETGFIDKLGTEKMLSGKALNTFVKDVFLEQADTILEEIYEGFKRRLFYLEYKERIADLMVNDKEEIKEKPRDKETILRMIFAEFQNSVLTIFIDKYLWNYTDDFKKYGIIDEEGKVDFSLSSLNKDLNSKISGWLEGILLDPVLGEDFIKRYLAQLVVSKGGRPVCIADCYSEDKAKRVEILAYVNNEKNDKVEIWVKNGGGIKNAVEVNFKEGVKILQWKNEDLKMLNFKGNLFLGISLLGGVFHIWSERWIREDLVKALTDHFIAKGIENQKYISMITALKLNEDYDPDSCNLQKKENFYRGFPAGSDNLQIEDIFKTMLMGDKYSQDQINQLIFDNLSIPNTDEITLFNSLTEKFEKFDFERWLQLVIGEMIKTDNYKEDIIKEYENAIRYKGNDFVEKIKATILKIGIYKHSENL